MTSVLHIIEIHDGDTAYSVKFLRDVVSKWHAEVSLPDGSKCSFRQDTFGPFHPCDQHAERLIWVAKGMVNSGRAA